jgi:hypothetical protein
MKMFKILKINEKGMVKIFYGSIWQIGNIASMAWGVKGIYRCIDGSIIDPKV